MEAQTCFDLNVALQDWRRELDQHPALTPERVRELETHLRDTMAELAARGLNAEESFWLARRRLGPVAQIGEEFASAEPGAVWRDRALWLAIALVCVEPVNRIMSFFVLKLLPIADGQITDSSQFDFQSLERRNLIWFFCYVACVLGVLAFLNNVAIALPWGRIRSWLTSRPARLLVRSGLAIVASGVALSFVSTFAVKSQWETFQHSAGGYLGWCQQFLLPFILLAYIERQWRRQDEHPAVKA